VVLKSGQRRCVMETNVEVSRLVHALSDEREGLQQYAMKKLLSMGY
jgi:hypothetical protein